MTFWMLGVVMVVILLAGLCLDMWRAVAAERSLATAVDAAATAGANGIDEAAYRADGTVRLDPATAEGLAADTMSMEPEYPRLSSLSISSTSARVTVRAEMVVPLTLMRIFVKTNPHVSATADGQPRGS